MAELSDEEFTRLYGPWAGNTPQEAAVFFADYDATWWVAGGWAVEAFTGIPRDHDDIDVSVFSNDLPRLRRHLAGRLDAWAALSGTLGPILPDDDPDGSAVDVLPEHCTQLWTRVSATEPWEFDILLSPGDDTTWVYKRDESIRMPLSDALWEHDGVRFLRPEIQLLYKARGNREKDRIDLRSTLPLLDDARRGWFADVLERTSPSHPWLSIITES